MTVTRATSSYDRRPPDYGRLLSRVDDLTDAATALRRLAKGYLPGANGRARVRIDSASAIGVAGVGSQSVLESSEEVNTVPTSIETFGPDWKKGSSAEATLGGVYDGSLGDKTLRFRVEEAGEVGSGDTIQIKVSSGAWQETLDFTGVAADTPLTLSNGVTLSLSAGTLKKTDDFRVDVFATVGSAVNPDNPFDGVRTEDPNFDPGYSVTAGSFTVNGETITVNADDSINSVLAKITASDAGVTATFDAATERVVLTHDNEGAHDIVLADDTSGFLAATKLDTAVLDLGTAGPTTALAYVPSFASLTAGDFSVNGHQITVDPLTDSLNDVLDRINAADADVRAFFNETTDEVHLVGDRGEDLELEHGSSNFLDLIKLQAKTYKAKGAGTGAFERPEKLTAALDEFVDSFRDFMGGAYGSLVDEAANRSKRRLGSDIRSGFVAHLDDDLSTLRSGFGLVLEKTDGVEQLRLDEVKFERSLDKDADTVFSFLFADGEEEGESAGILHALPDALAGMRDSIISEARWRGAGSLIDLSA